MVRFLVTYTESIVLAWFDIDIKVSGVSSNLPSHHEGGIFVVRIIPLDLEIVHTFEIQHRSPTQPDPRLDFNIKNLTLLEYNQMLTCQQWVCPSYLKWH